ncbi:ABC transporter substrate-binding protein [Miltoncostaea oceani]|uniref:ABC transporter substrate-binding protein n=1 Tax=Miltoncostaea oceani TaxID=2843216 RepID=UPI001C3D3F79|nr:ABC transporter substrate-binding protein [Miltoncostaea oceani]
MALRAAAALSLSGRFGPLGSQAGAGLDAWARDRGVRLRIEDDGSDPARSARLCAGLAGSADLLFGPYGSGAGRAVAEAMDGRPEVVWNHGAAAVPRRAARLVDVLGPARSYWRGLPAVLGPAPRVAIVRAPGGFGAEVAEGAAAAFAAAGVAPVADVALDPGDPGAAVRAAAGAGAAWVVGGGRLEDDLALGRALAGSGIAAALVACGVAEAGRALGDAVVGWLGPVQWDGTPGPVALPPGCDYPAAQALAAGLVAEEAVARAGSTAPDALWDAARALRTHTLIGPFAVDDAGRQTAHAPVIVRWERGPGGPHRVVVPRADTGEP